MRTPKGHVTLVQYLHSPELPIQKCDIEEYKKILEFISGNRLNIKEIACLIGKSNTAIGLKIQILENRGFVKKIFAGKSRVPIITEDGRVLIEGHTV